MRAAVVQINTTSDRDANVERAARLVADAAADGAELVVLPEKWNLIGDAETMLAGAEPLEGPSLSAAAGWAADHGVHLVAGSVGERVDGAERISNTSVLFGPDGARLAAYRKIHMFDVDVGGVSYRESEVEAPGDEIVLAEAGALALGLTICYDLRFPELFRILALRGARAISLPSAFTLHTGRDHWEPLIRARAIENQLFMLAPGQIGEAPPHYNSYGRSMIVDPWGVVLATVPDGEGHAAADLDLDRLEQVRSDLPSLANRRPETYSWPAVAPSAAGVGTGS